MSVDGTLNADRNQNDHISTTTKTNTPQKFPMISTDRALLWVLSLALFAILSISFFTKFGFHNDYSAWQWPYPETKFWFQEGRPLGSTLQNIQFYFFRHIADFTWGRIVSSVATVAGFLLTGSLFKKLAPSAGRLAFLAAFLIWVLPPALLYVLWLESFALGTVGSILVIVSYFVVNSSYYAVNRYNRLFLRLCGYFLLYVCFFIYQPTAYFFLVFTSWRSLFSNDNQGLRRVLEELIAVAVLSGAYFVFLKIGLAPLLHMIFGPTVNPVSEGQYAVSPVLDIFGQITIAVAFLAQSLTLWFAPFGGDSTPVIALIILIGLGCRIFQNRETFAALIWEISRWGGALLCCLLATAPFVLSHFGAFPPTRVMFSVQGILVIFLLAAARCILKPVPKIGILVAGLLASAAALLAGLTVYAVTINASTEFKFLKNSLDGVPKTSGPVILLLPPYGDQILDNWLSEFIYGDFALTATSAYPVVGVVKMILRDEGADPTDTPVSFIPWESNVIIEEDQQEDTVSRPLHVINMKFAGFQAAGKQDQIHQSQSLFVSVSNLNALGSGDSSVASAFDMKIPLAWETKTALPIDVTVRSLKPCLNVSAYAFRADLYAPERMPRSWQVLEKSPNDQDFKVVDTIANAPLWTKGEERRFSLPAAGCVSALKFRFISLEASDILRISKIILLPH